MKHKRNELCLYAVLYLRCLSSLRQQIFMCMKATNTCQRKHLENACTSRLFSDDTAQDTSTVF